ncbi:hypothetical protein ATER59S_02071 [Aquamicrobium terrae]
MKAVGWRRRDMERGGHEAIWALPAPCSLLYHGSGAAADAAVRIHPKGQREAA